MNKYILAICVGSSSVFNCSAMLSRIALRTMSLWPPVQSPRYLSTESDQSSMTLTKNAERLLDCQSKLPGFKYRRLPESDAKVSKSRCVRNAKIVVSCAAFMATPFLICKGHDILPIICGVAAAGSMISGFETQSLLVEQEKDNAYYHKTTEELEEAISYLSGDLARRIIEQEKAKNS